jgi:hypothetical protein
MARQRQKRGRPALPARERRRNNLTIRLTDAARSNLKRLAARDGRSLSEALEELANEEHLVRILSTGAFGLSELLDFRDYAETVRAEVSRLGGDRERWRAYARHFRFPLSTNVDERAHDLERARQGLRSQLDEEAASDASIDDRRRKIQQELDQ